MTKITRMIVPSNKKNHPNQKLKAINYITIHNTGNYSPTADALNHAKWLNRGSDGKQTSFHYAVDSKSIYQMFEDNSRCWHAGDGSNGTGNAESIGVEICVHDKAGFVKACENAAELTASLLKKHGLKIDRVKQHNNWSGKDCPKEIRSGTWGITWAGFIKLVENALSPPKPVTPPASNVTISKYSVVKVKSTAKNYGGQSKSVAIPDFVKKGTYTIAQISSTEALLAGINSWVKISDLEVVSAPSKAKQVTITATKTVAEKDIVGIVESLKKQGYAVSTKTI